MAINRSGLLATGDKLQFGDTLTSANGAYELSFKSDGNLVLWHIPSATPLWNMSRTSGLDAVLSFQSDGNLVVRHQSGSRVAWHVAETGAQVMPGSSLRVTDTGNLELRSAAGSLVWQSGTGNPDRVTSISDIGRADIVQVAGEALMPSGFAALSTPVKLGIAAAVFSGLMIVLRR